MSDIHSPVNNEYATNLITKSPNTYSHKKYRENEAKSKVSCRNKHFSVGTWTWRTRYRWLQVLATLDQFWKSWCYQHLSAGAQRGAFWVWTLFTGELHIPKGDKWPLKVTINNCSLRRIFVSTINLDITLSLNFTSGRQGMCVTFIHFRTHEAVYNHIIYSSTLKKKIRGQIRT